jgi:glutathione S-transferase
VRRSAHKLNLPLEYRDVRENDRYRKELEEGGGKVQVPCLRIDREDNTEWMYESDDIIDYLEDKFG